MRRATATTPVLCRAPDLTALAEAAATDLADRIACVIDTRGLCRVALAGGTTPRPVYERIARSDLAARIDWTRVDLFFGDERCVPPDDEASNYRMVEQALVARLGAKPRVHRIAGEEPPADAARAYAAEMGDAPLDVVVLGMGGDGHTASLFPGRPEAQERSARVVPARAPTPPVERVSLTLRAINEAGAVRFWVSGEDKAARVAEVFREIESGAPALPAAQVWPESGELIWFLDDAAARRL